MIRSITVAKTESMSIDELSSFDELEDICEPCEPVVEAEITRQTSYTPLTKALPDDIVDFVTYDADSQKWSCKYCVFAKGFNPYATGRKIPSKALISRMRVHKKSRCHTIAEKVFHERANECRPESVVEFESRVGNDFADYAVFFGYSHDVFCTMRCALTDALDESLADDWALVEANSTD